VNPPTVTVYSTDTAAVDALPGSIQTRVISLVGRQEDFTEIIELNLPGNMQVIGNPQVEVKVDIEPVVSSIALSDIPLSEIGLASNLTAKFLPERANIIITGPLPILDTIFVSDVRVLIDLTGYLPGTFTLTNPILSLNIPGLSIESISPSTFEVTISSAN
jgi:hypothetical protein